MPSQHSGPFALLDHEVEPNGWPMEKMVKHYKHRVMWTVVQVNGQ